MLLWEGQLGWFWNKIKHTFKSKHRGRIGPAPGGLKQNRILNRVVGWTGKGIFYDGDQRLAEICMHEIGIVDNSRDVSTPVDRAIKLQKKSAILEPKVATRYLV